MIKKNMKHNRITCSPVSLFAENWRSWNRRANGQIQKLANLPVQVISNIYSYI